MAYKNKRHFYREQAKSNNKKLDFEIQDLIEQ